MILPVYFRRSIAEIDKNTLGTGVVFIPQGHPMGSWTLVCIDPATVVALEHSSLENLHYIGPYQGVETYQFDPGRKYPHSIGTIEKYLREGGFTPDFRNFPRWLDP